MHVGSIARCIVRARLAERKVRSRGVKCRQAARTWPVCARAPGLVADRDLAPVHITPRGVP